MLLAGPLLMHSLFRFSLCCRALGAEAAARLCRQQPCLPYLTIAQSFVCKQLPLLQAFGRTGGGAPVLDALAGLANRLLTADASEVDLHTAVCMRLLPVLVGRRSRCLRLVHLHHWQQLAGGALGAVLPEACVFDGPAHSRVHVHVHVHMYAACCRCLWSSTAGYLRPVHLRHWLQLADGVPGAVLPDMRHVLGLRPSPGVVASDLGCLAADIRHVPAVSAGRLPSTQAWLWCTRGSSRPVDEVPINGTDHAGVTRPGP